VKLGKDVGNGGVAASSSESTVGRIRSMREFLPHFLAGGFG